MSSSFSAFPLKVSILQFSADRQDPITSKLLGVHSGVDGLEQFAHYKGAWGKWWRIPTEVGNAETLSRILILRSFHPALQPYLALDTCHCVMCLLVPTVSFSDSLCSSLPISAPKSFPQGLGLIIECKATEQRARKGVGLGGSLRKEEPRHLRGRDAGFLSLAGRLGHPPELPVLPP